MIHNKYVINNIKIFFSTIIILVFGCSGYEEIPFVDTIAPTTVNVKKQDDNLAEDNELFVGDSFTLGDVTVTLRNNKTETITPTWSSSDVSIATVEKASPTLSSNGRAKANGEKWVVKAKKPGMVRITGSYSFDNAGISVSKEIIKEFNFKFKADPTLRITSNITSLQKDSTESITAECNDDTMMPIIGNKLSWTTSDATKIRINGETTGPSISVNALEMGSDIMLTCTCTDETKGINLTKTVTLSVTAGETQREAMISINPHDATLRVKASSTLEITFINSSGMNETISPTWSVDDNSKATITSAGVLTGVAIGQVTITASYTPSGESIVTDTTTVEIVPAPVPLRTRTAVLDVRDSYGVDGTVTLEKLTNGRIKIIFGNDFKYGGIPDPWAYLSKNRNPASNSIGLFNLKEHPELGDRSGPYEYVLPESVTSIDQYDWIVIYCKRFRSVMDAKEFSE